MKKYLYLLLFVFTTTLWSTNFSIKDKKIVKQELKKIQKDTLKKDKVAKKEVVVVDSLLEFKGKFKPYMKNAHASYYADKFHGKRTASGAAFHPMGLTAAHRSMRFGTRLRVTYGDRSVVVTVNDRGPFIKGRVLDLSIAAAAAVGLTSAGVGQVTAEVL